MAIIGKRNRVRVLRATAQGLYVDGEELGEVLLPSRYCTPAMFPGLDIEVFVYRDSEDRLVATTDIPHVVAGEFGYLRVVEVNPRIGAFLDWGLEKDLLLPMREWPKATLRAGDRLVVRVLVDERSDRIVASARLARYLDRVEADYAEGQAVDALIEGRTELGYRAIINHEHRGLLYHSDVAEPLAVGRTLTAYVLKVRGDGKIDLTLHRSGYDRIRPLTQRIMTRLAESGGRLPYHDGSAPAEIQDAFGVSKKAFKQAIGALFRQRRIVIEDEGIREAAEPEP